MFIRCPQHLPNPAIGLDPVYRQGKWLAILYLVGKFEKVSVYVPPLHIVGFLAIPSVYISISVHEREIEKRGTLTVWRVRRICTTLAGTNIGTNIGTTPDYKETYLRPV